MVVVVVVDVVVVSENEKPNYFVEQDYQIWRNIVHHLKYEHCIHPTHPLIAFDHLSLYIQKHLSQSLAVCGSLW